MGPTILLVFLYVVMLVFISDCQRMQLQPDSCRCEKKAQPHELLIQQIREIPNWAPLLMQQIEQGSTMGSDLWR